MKVIFISLISCFAVVSSVSALDKNDQDEVEITAAQAAAVSRVVNDLTKNGGGLPACHVRIESTDGGIDVTFFDRAEEANLYRVGVESKDCNFVYSLNSSGSKILEKVYQK